LREFHATSFAKNICKHKSLLIKDLRKTFRFYFYNSLRNCLHNSFASAILSSVGSAVTDCQRPAESQFGLWFRQGGPFITDGIASICEVASVMRVQVLVRGFVEMNKEAMQRVARCEREGLCCSCLEPLDERTELAKEAEEEVRSIRGCHPRCAHATYRGIRAGKLTDEGQVASGEWLPAESGGRPATLAATKKAQRIGKAG
jgi:hypothetical protein